MLIEFVTPERTLIEETIANTIVQEDEGIDERVLRGAALLDERVPGWANKINLSTFGLMSCELCVLGQVYGDYDNGGERLWGEGWDDSGLPEAHAFDSGSGTTRDWRFLQENWVKAITRRQTKVIA